MLPFFPLVRFFGLAFLSSELLLIYHRSVGICTPFFLAADEENRLFFSPLLTFPHESFFA